jgi:cytochrome P450
MVHRLGEVVGKGLITSDDVLWRSQRRLIQPAFHQARLERYGAQMAGYAERLIDEWQDGHAREIQLDMMRLTLGIICRTVFGVDVDAEASEIGQAFGVAIEAVGG